MGFRSSKSSEWISASNVGRANYCPHALERDLKGSKISEESKRARMRGNTKHDSLNKIIIQQASTDKRCYIATHLYGIDDHRTQQLRRFRDTTLTQSSSGRLFIKIYYFLSPYIVKASEKAPWIDKLLRPLIDKLIKPL
ncbi:MAG: hypothetical protein ACJAS1_001459 [Oleiphilaceae bacterium]|jgi:hypothetical protein